MAKFYVYVASAGTQAMKVGVSSNPQKRLADLQTHSPHKVKMSLLFECRSEAHARNVEYTCHLWLKRDGLHRRGEWFVYDIRKARKALDKITGTKMVNPDDVIQPKRLRVLVDPLQSHTEGDRIA